MKWAILMVLACVAAGTTTQPATQPSRDDLARKLDEARDAVAKAKAAAIERCRSTPAYQAAAGDRDMKEKTLQNARANGSPQERLIASSAFVKADQRVKRLEADAVSKDAELRDAEAEEAKAQSRVAEQDAWEKHQVEAARQAVENDPVHVAIRQHQPILGMTFEELEKAVAPMKLTREFVENRDGHAVEIWRCRQATTTMVVDGGGPTTVHQIPETHYGPWHHYQLTDGKLASITE